MKASLGATGALASFLRRRARLLVLGALVIGVVGSAQAATSTKFFSTTVAPSSVAAGTAKNFTVTITNSTSSTQSLGSANVAVPSAFTGVSATLASAPTGKSWTAGYVSPDVQFRSATNMDALAPGQSVSASVTATAPCSSGNYTWTSTAKQSNNYSGPPGNNFLLEGLQPVVEVTGSSVVDHLGFSTQPAALVAKSPSTFSVGVTAYDSCNNVASAASGNVSLAIASGPSFVLGGTTSQPLVNGVATFSDLNIAVAGAGYTLGASLSGATGATSSSFTVADQVCTASPCTGHDADSNTFAEITFNSGSIGLSFLNPGSGFPGCGSGTLTPVGSVASIVPDAVTGTKTVVLRYSKQAAPGTGVANFVQCFTTDGQNWTQLAPCGKKPQPPCVLKKNRNGVGELVVELLLPAGDPGVGTGFG